MIFPLCPGKVTLMYPHIDDKALRTTFLYSYDVFIIIECLTRIENTTSLNPKMIVCKCVEMTKSSRCAQAMVLLLTKDLTKDLMAFLNVSRGTTHTFIHL